MVSSIYVSNRVLWIFTYSSIKVAMAEQLLKGNDRAAGTYGDMGTGPHQYLANKLTLPIIKEVHISFE